MDAATATDLARDAVIIALLISGPILATGVVIGLIISLLQTVTQLQDQTLSIVPKIVAMLAAAIFFLPWIGMQLIEYTRAIFAGP